MIVMKMMIVTLIQQCELSEALLGLFVKRYPSAMYAQNRCVTDFMQDSLTPLQHHPLRLKHKKHRSTFTFETI